MAGTAQFTIGAEASCSDGVAGTVTRVIVDPVAEAVTHLVVEPEHRRDVGRLVPLDLVDGAAGEIRLRCTRAEFEKLDPAEETRFIPATSGYEGYGSGQLGYWPYYGLSGGMGAAGLGLGVGGGVGGGTPSQVVTSDTVPLGEVDVCRGDRVHATDGDIGRVQGLVVDPRSRHVTHVLLQEGHLWGRKEVAIPVSAVASTTGGIQLTITKQEVQDLPPVDTDHPDWGTGGAAGHELGAEAPPGAPADPADRTRHLKAAEPGT
jgi:sporulation protein YlmC with PRC-barrel domain